MPLWTWGRRPFQLLTGVLAVGSLTLAVWWVGANRRAAAWFDGDRDTWLAGCEPGQPAVGSGNPLLFEAGAAAAGGDGAGDRPGG